MATRQLTDEERELSTLLATAMETMANVQAAMLAVRNAGGDCKLSFLSIVPEESRGTAELQWPMIAMLLGI